MLPAITNANLLIGLDAGDDAAVYRLDDERALVCTVDFFPPVVDDPFSYGSIAAANSLSDVYAMGGKPILALNIVGFPADVPKDMLGEILKGGHFKAHEAGCLIVGGHTIEDAEPKYGLAVVGLVAPGQEIANSGCREGDKLILTKPLGTGVITTAGKQRVVDQDVMSKAITVMSTLNDQASYAMIKIGVNAATDVTGFGLIGHLKGMMASSNTQAKIYLHKVPALPGAWTLIERGIVPKGTHRNLSAMESSVAWDNTIAPEGKLFLCDSQTSGGLLISVSAEKANSLLGELLSSNVESATIIGEVMSPGDRYIQVVA